MPIKVKFEIYDSKHAAPHYIGYDVDLARAEYYDLIRKGGDVYRLVQTVETESALTKSEEYLLLAYNIRRLWKKYFGAGRDKEVLKESVALEHQLDKWNQRTDAYIASHPGYQPADKKAHAFFLLMAEWRKTWKERKKYVTSKDPDERIIKEMSRKCRDYEKEIDKYIKETIGMI